MAEVEEEDKVAEAEGEVEEEDLEGIDPKIMEAEWGRIEGPGKKVVGIGSEAVVIVKTRGSN